MKFIRKRSTTYRIRETRRQLIGVLQCTGTRRYFTVSTNGRNHTR